MYEAKHCSTCGESLGGKPFIGNGGKVFCNSACQNLFAATGGQVGPTALAPNQGELAFDSIRPSTPAKEYPPVGYFDSIRD